MSHPENVPRVLRWLNKVAQKGWIRFDQYSPLKRLAIVFYYCMEGFMAPYVAGDPSLESAMGSL